MGGQADASELLAAIVLCSLARTHVREGALGEVALDCGEVYELFEGSLNATHQPSTTLDRSPRLCSSRN